MARIPCALGEVSMKWSVLCVAIQAVAVASLAAAQSGEMKMAQPEMAPVTYTGCVEAGSAGRTFTLTHVGSMSKDSMAKDGMAKDGMAKDGMAKDGMKADAAGMGKMSHDAMAPATVSLAAKSSIDLKKHVGQKVSVTGTPAQGQMDAAGMAVAAFNVTSIKTIAKSCS
jgi:pentapeptide MXKDX repeat protein